MEGKEDKMLEKLREINNKIINKETDKKNLKKHKLIEKLLNDNFIFFKIDIEYAYAILRDLGIKEENLKDIYMELIDIKNT